MTEKIRIARALAMAGINSRRKCEEHISAGEVTVNEKVVVNLATRVDIENDEICFRRRPVVFENNVYYLLFKPAGYTTTAKDAHAKKTVYDLLPRKLVSRFKKGRDEQVRVFPVGRLDRDSTGLLLFTNHGELANRLTHPRYGVAKIYEVRLDRAFDARDNQKMLQGIRLKDGIARVEKVTQITKRVLRLRIREGKKREVRRIFEAMEYKVVALCRTVFGPFKLEGLRPGEGCYVGKKEMAKLFKDMGIDQKKK